MTVNLSALAGAGQQFLDNNGTPLSGGKLYSYEAGTTVPQVTYTTASGSTPHTNPIILDSAGRIATGEIWLTAGQTYKFVLATSDDVVIATWDNITGINGTGIATNASVVAYDPAGANAVATTVQSKLREIVSVKDFGAVGNGIADDTVAIQNAIDAAPASGQTIYFPIGTYKITASLSISNKKGIRLLGESKENCVLAKAYSSGGPMVHFFQGNYWAIDFLFFQGLGDSSGTDPLIYIEGSSYGRMTMCKVFNGRGPGIKIEQGTSVNGAYFNTIQDNHFFNNGVGQGVNGSNVYCGLESSETKLIGGECQSSPGAGWYIAGGNGQTGLGASIEGNTNYGVRAANSTEVALFGCRFEGGGVMQYGVYAEGTLTTIGAFGCHFTSNVVGDIFPAAGSARITYISNNNSTSPAAYRVEGVSSWQPEIKLGGDFFTVKNVSGATEIRGNSTTRLTNNLNGLELGSANGILYLNNPVLTLNFQAVPGLVWRVGSGSPEGNVTAAVGSLYTRTNGGAGTTLYVKESGAGNTGWVAK